MEEFRKLPIEELIAEKPLDKRDESNLMVIHKKTGKIEHRKFKDIIEYFSEGDCLILNETKVIKARIYGIRVKDDKKIDFLLLNPVDNSKTSWKLLARKLKPTNKYILNGGIEIKNIIRNSDGSYTLTFSDPLTDEYMEKYGDVPLPNYILKKRKEKNTNINEAEDLTKYQTVYAKEKGSVAAPTAGFHFTDELLNNLVNSKKVRIARLILHIGWGTFKMVRENPENFKMPGEYCYIPEETARIINEAKENNKNIFAVGTSSMRTIESMSDENGFVKSGEKLADIFIKPGYKFKVANRFITNLHVPDSPPLYMTVAFCGYELLLKAYREAIERKYRFYSYGDSTLIID